MRLTSRMKARLRAVCRANLLARPPHPTRIELVRVTVRVEYRDGEIIELTEEAWK